MSLRAQLESKLYLTTAELAERWRTSPHTINAWRARGEGPPWVKLMTGAVLYDAEVILRIETEGARGLTLPRIREAIFATVDVDETAKEKIAEHVSKSLVD